MRLPERTHTYQNHHMDSTRWDYFSPRPDDIVIATSYKAGTTWTQAIVAHLLFQDGEFPAEKVSDMSPWLDMRVVPLEFVLQLLDAQTHRRFIKTHLPLDGMRYDQSTRYLYVSRDARDVFMSLWNHYTNHVDSHYLLMNELAGRVGDEFPRPPEDIHEFWKNWITRGWFEWETDGWPYWSHLSNVQSWFDWRHLPNIQLVHFNDLLEDLEGEVGRIAEFLGIPISPDDLRTVAKAVSFVEMKQKGDRYAPGGGMHWQGGAETFLHKGTNGRWRELLSQDELALYDAACERALTPECRAWLENGGPA
jgi:aryl sulfotransferase